LQGASEVNPTLILPILNKINPLKHLPLIFHVYNKHTY
jgi:hypothetical protein